MKKKKYQGAKIIKKKKKKWNKEIMIEKNYVKKYIIVPSLTCLEQYK